MNGVGKDSGRHTGVTRESQAERAGQCGTMEPGSGHREAQRMDAGGSKCRRELRARLGGPDAMGLSAQDSARGSKGGTRVQDIPVQGPDVGGGRPADSWDQGRSLQQTWMT